MNWQPPSFERYQFAGKRSQAVVATSTPEGWDTTGIHSATIE
jgi:hypothetical protein